MAKRNTKQTSPEVATLAGKTLSNPTAKKTVKKISASAVSQAGGGGKPTPADQKWKVKNPNSPDHKKAGDNRANQKNPNHTPTKGDKK